MPAAKWGAVNALLDHKLVASSINRLAPSSPLTVFTYHRIDTPGRRDDLDDTLISATPDGFAAQINSLRASYTLCSLEDVLAAYEHQQPLPPRAALITFDDAYRDFLTNAWPVLREQQIRPVLFVPTAYADDQNRYFWWDYLARLVRAGAEAELASRLTANPTGTSLREMKRTLKQLPPADVIAIIESAGEKAGVAPPADSVLDWPALAALKAEGVTICPHTVTHPILTQLDLDAAQAEMADSLSLVRARLGDCPPVLAYPSGYENLQVRERCAAAGFKLAFGTQFGSVRCDRSDPFNLPRVNVSRFAGPHSVSTIGALSRW